MDTNKSNTKAPPINDKPRSPSFLGRRQLKVLDSAGILKSATSHFQNHSCDLCEHLSTPTEKSHFHLQQISPNLPHQIMPLEPFDFTNFRPPNIFIENNILKHLAISLQHLLTFGLNFQIPTENAQPFQSPFAHLLRLNENLPPLTHFQLPRWKEKLYTSFTNKFTTLKTQLKQTKSTVLQVDKGTGLVIITHITLNRIYNLYLADKEALTPAQAFHITLDLRKAITDLDPTQKKLQEDDRIQHSILK